MRTDMRITARLLALAALLTLTIACGGSLAATNIQLGRSLNSDNTVGNHTTSFKSTDTIYAAVQTGASGSGVVSARWTYAGRVISEPQKKVSYRGEASTEFHLQNSGGFPAGDYEVELFIDGMSVGARKFRITQ
jgi:hypothetical protein